MSQCSAVIFSDSRILQNVQIGMVALRENVRRDQKGDVRREKKADVSRQKKGDKEKTNTESE
jgi:hypothetical protein